MLFQEIGGGGCLRERGGDFETLRAQQLDPHIGREERRVRTQVILEVLPSLDQAGGDVVPWVMPGRLNQQQDPTRRQQATCAVHRITNISRGVDHVRGDHHVPLPLRDPLIHRLFFQVEQPGAQEGDVAEAFGGEIEEDVRDVGVEVIRPILRQDTGEKGGGAARPGPDLQNTDGRTGRAFSDEPLQRSCPDPVDIA